MGIESLKNSVRISVSKNGQLKSKTVSRTLGWSNKWGKTGQICPQSTFASTRDFTNYITNSNSTT